MTVTVNYKVVTSAMIGACYKVFDAAGKPFYMVENSKGECDEAGHLIEYKVEAIFRQNKWHVTCNCKAGNEGRMCWHKRAAMAASAEEKQAMAEQVALNEAAKVAEQVKPVATAKPQAAKKTRKSDEGALLHQSRMRGIADILAANRMARECMPHAYNQK